jgi:hypothetical protein
VSDSTEQSSQDGNAQVRDSGLSGSRGAAMNQYLVKIKKNRNDNSHISFYIRAKDKRIILDMFETGQYYAVGVEEVRKEKLQ